jgi:hypothetical protein
LGIAAESHNAAPVLVRTLAIQPRLNGRKAVVWQATDKCQLASQARQPGGDPAARSAAFLLNDDLDANRRWLFAHRLPSGFMKRASIILRRLEVIL